MDTERKSPRSAHSGCSLSKPRPSKPMLQLCKRLVCKGAKATFAVTKFISKSFNPQSDVVAIETISDGFDDGGFTLANDVADYLTRMELSGSKTLSELVETYQKSDHPIDCIVYDSFLPWALEVAKKFGVTGAALFTQCCAVNCVYHCVHAGVLKLPVEAAPVEIPGLPPLDLPDMPSYIYEHGSYPAYFEMVLKQFVEKRGFTNPDKYNNRNLR